MVTQTKLDFKKTLSSVGQDYILIREGIKKSEPAPSISIFDAIYGEPVSHETESLTENNFNVRLLVQLISTGQEGWVRMLNREDLVKGDGIAFSSSEYVIDNQPIILKEGDILQAKNDSSKQWKIDGSIAMLDINGIVFKQLFIKQI